MVVPSCSDSLWGQPGLRHTWNGRARLFGIGGRGHHLHLRQRTMNIAQTIVELRTGDLCLDDFRLSLGAEVHQAHLEGVHAASMCRAAAR